MSRRESRPGSGSVGRKGRLMEKLGTSRGDRGGAAPPPSLVLLRDSRREALVSSCFVRLSAVVKSGKCLGVVGLEDTGGEDTFDGMGESVRAGGEPSPSSRSSPEELCGDSSTLSTTSMCSSSSSSSCLVGLSGSWSEGLQGERLRPTSDEIVKDEARSSDDLDGSGLVCLGLSTSATQTTIYLFVFKVYCTYTFEKLIINTYTPKLLLFCVFCLRCCAY